MATRKTDKKITEVLVTSHLKTAALRFYHARFIKTYFTMAYRIGFGEKRVVGQRESFYGTPFWCRYFTSPHSLF